MKKMNKGFSLVELIIVIAIMAILIGVLAPQYMKYVERSRISADKDLADSIYNAFTTAASDPDVTDGPAASTASCFTDMDGTTDFASSVQETLGVNGANSSTTISNKLKSKSYKGGAITVSTDAQGNFHVNVANTGNGSATADIDIPEI